MQEVFIHSRGVALGVVIFPSLGTCVFILFSTRMCIVTGYQVVVLWDRFIYVSRCKETTKGWSYNYRS